MERFCEIRRNYELGRVRSEQLDGDQDSLPLVDASGNVNPTMRETWYAASEGYYVFMHM